MSYNVEPLKASTLLEFSNGDKIELQGYVPEFSLVIDNHLDCGFNFDKFRTVDFSMQMELTPETRNQLKIMLSPKVEWYKRLSNRFADLVYEGLHSFRNRKRRVRLL
jgi:hypothetical protein